MTTHGRRKPREVEDLILATIRETPQGLTAYEVMAGLAKRHLRLAPTQAYRSLGRLIDRGIVRRIESLNCYYGLKGAAAETVMLFCRSCRGTVEVTCPTVGESLREIAGKNGIHLVRAIAEVGGVCPECQSSEARVTR